MFLGTAILNLILAMPALYATQTSRSSSPVLSALVGAAAVALPAYFMSIPLFSFEARPERGFDLIPLLVFIVSGALTGIFHTVCVRRAHA